MSKDNIRKYDHAPENIETLAEFTPEYVPAYLSNYLSGYYSELMWTTGFSDDAETLHEPSIGKHFPEMILAGESVSFL